MKLTSLLLLLATSSLYGNLFDRIGRGRSGITISYGIPNHQEVISMEEDQEINTDINEMMNKMINNNQQQQHQSLLSKFMKHQKPMHLEQDGNDHEVSQPLQIEQVEHERSNTMNDIISAIMNSNEQHITHEETQPILSFGNFGSFHHIEAEDSQPHAQIIAFGSNDKEESNSPVHSMFSAIFGNMLSSLFSSKCDTSHTSNFIQAPVRRHALTFVIPKLDFRMEMKHSVSSCRADVVKYCEGLEGMVRTAACLHEYFDSLNPSCQEHLKSIPIFECASDALKLCPNAGTRKEAVQCLSNHLEYIENEKCVDVIKGHSDKVEDVKYELVKSSSESESVSASESSGDSNLHIQDKNVEVAPKAEVAAEVHLTDPSKEVVKLVSGDIEKIENIISKSETNTHSAETESVPSKTIAAPKHTPLTPVSYIWAIFLTLGIALFTFGSVFACSIYCQKPKVELKVVESYDEEPMNNSLVPPRTHIEVEILSVVEPKLQN